jgi:hypothetical protein
VFSPSEYFSALGEKPSWLVPFLLSAAAAMAVGWGMLPFATRALETGFPSGIPAERLEAMRTQMLFGQHLGIFLGPVTLLIKSALCAVVLAMLSQIIAGRGTFRQMLVLVSYVLPFGVLESLHTLIALNIRGIDAIQNPLGIQLALGLNLLVRNAPPAIDSLLQSVNIYQILGFVYLVIGLRAVLQIRRASAISIAALYWSIGAALAMGLTIIAHDLQGNA